VEFALAWYLTLKTGSATVLATAMLVAFLPQIILGPIIGPFVDRWNRKRIMILADSGIALITVGLVILFFTGAIQVWHIYVAMVLRAAGQSIHFPALQASITLIVPEKHLSRAAGLNQMLQGIIGIAAPPAGALLMELLPMQGVLAVDIFTASIAVGCLLMVFIPQPERTQAAAKATIMADMLEGFRYVWSWRGLRILIGISAILGLFLTPAFTLLPILVNNHLGGGVVIKGRMESALGVGIIAGGLLLGVWGGFRKRILTAVMGIIIGGVSTIGLGFTSIAWYMLGLAACFLIGFGLTLANGPIMAVLQALVAKDMQGRVFSLAGSLSAIMTPMGLAVAGPVADALGIRSIYYIAGAVVVMVALSALSIPSLINLEEAAKKTGLETDTENIADKEYS